MGCGWRRRRLCDGDDAYAAGEAGDAFDAADRGEELRSLRRLQREYPTSPFVFQSSRKGPLANDSIAGIVEQAGELANLQFPTIHTCCGMGRGTIWQIKG